MKFEVLQEDIYTAQVHVAKQKEKGNKDLRLSEHCPIAIACKRIGLRHPQVSLESVFAFQVSESLPFEATQFLTNFIAGNPVVPFMFETTTRVSFSWTEADGQLSEVRRLSKKGAI